MIRALRILAALLLAILQLCSPWVHAHSGQETGAAWHMPGMEALGLGQRACPAAIAGSDGLAMADMIVTIGAGCETKADRLAPIQPFAQASPPLPVPSPVFLLVNMRLVSEPPTGPPIYPRSPPRAPPFTA